MENRSAQCFFLLLCPWYVWKENERKGRKIGGEESSFLKKFLFSLLLLDLFLYISLAQRGVNNRYTKLEKARHRVEIRNRIRNFQIQIIFQSYFLVLKTSIKIRQRSWRFRTNRKLMERDKEGDSKQGMKKGARIKFSNGTSSPSFQGRY